jgi:phosphoribosylaminoimidazole-succinocarboxamide synthase
MSNKIKTEAEEYVLEQIKNFDVKLKEYYKKDNLVYFLIKLKTKLEDDDRSTSLNEINKHLTKK